MSSVSTPPERTPRLSFKSLEAEEILARDTEEDDRELPNMDDIVRARRKSLTLHETALTPAKLLRKVATHTRSKLCVREQAASSRRQSLQLSETLQMRTFHKYEWRHFSQKKYVCATSHCDHFTAYFSPTAPNIPDGFENEKKAVLIKRLSKTTIFCKESQQTLKDQLDCEMHILGSAQHENIATFLGSGPDPHGNLFLVMHVSKGSMLADMLDHEYTSGKEVLNLEATLSILTQLANVLGYLHAQKPCVVLNALDPTAINISRKTNHVHLTDLTSVQVLEEKRNKVKSYHDLSGRGCSLAYLAPELFLSKHYDEKIDVYAFGILAWQMLFNSLPFPHVDTKADYIENVVKQKERPELPEGTSPQITALLTATWHASPRKRPSFEAIQSMLADLTQVQATLTLPPVAKFYAILSPNVRNHRRRRRSTQSDVRRLERPVLPKSKPTSPALSRDQSETSDASKASESEPVETVDYARAELRMNRRRRSRCASMESDEEHRKELAAQSMCSIDLDNCTIM